MGDGNVRCYVSLLSLMFVWDGVGGVGDGNVRWYVSLLSLMGWVGWGMVTFVGTSSCCPGWGGWGGGW